MKLKSFINGLLAAAFLAFGISSVQAIDRGTPDILSSISSNSVHVLTKAESAQVRGEYYTECTVFNRTFRCSGPQTSRTWPVAHTFPGPGRRHVLTYITPHGWFVSR